MAMMLRRRRWITAVALVLLAGLGYALLMTSKPHVAEQLVCTDIVHGCGNVELRVQAMMAPRVMQAFELRLQVPGAESVRADFDMKQMQMGLNRYRFQHQPDGSWRAMVTLPVCSAGRSDWLMSIEIKDVNGELKRYQLEFSAEP